MTSMLRLLFVSLCVLASSVAAARPVITLCPANRPQIDGVIAPGEWESAQTIDIQVNVPEGGAAPARLYVMNDAQNLYVAMRIVRAAADASSTLSVNLDADYDRTLSAGDDTLGVFYDQSGGSVSFDNVHYTGGECPQDAVCSTADSERGGTNDVAGAVGSDGTYVIYELSKPLMTPGGLDATMLSGTSMAMTFAVRLLSAGAEWPNGVADTYYPSVPSAGLYVDYTIRYCGGIDQ